MIVVETAIRAWVEPDRPRGRHKRDPPWRPQRYGDRVLVFDTETTTDHSQRLLFGFFRIYARDKLAMEGIIAAEKLDQDAMLAINEYAARNRLPVLSREEFIEKMFFPEVYDLGTLCVGYNHLLFDLPRLALDAGCGRGKNRRRFRLKLSRRIHVHDLHIEAASGHATFAAFVPKRKLHKWERPFFKGRFLDLSTLVRALTGTPRTLKSACEAFGTHTHKMGIEEYGRVNRRTLTYGRQDVRATWALFRKVREEYARHPFATFENERNKPQDSAYMGELYSSASMTKAYFRKLGFQPLLQRQPEFGRHFLGYGMAAYFGGRSEVRVRKRDVPVAVVDFTSMYPTLFILQDLQSLASGDLIVEAMPVREAEHLVAMLTPERLYDPHVWPLLNCLVRVGPNGAVLPTRFIPPEALSGVRRKRSKDFTIAVTPLHASETRWYTLADVVAAGLLGDIKPKFVEALRIGAKGAASPQTVAFRGEVPLSNREPILRTLVEERQRLKSSGGESHLANGLKITANSAYGIFAEVNVTPHNLEKPPRGHVYSEISFECANIHDERPGAFSNAILASLITGGARLMLALLEYEVTVAGGTFAFCDTDSLAIVCGTGCPSDFPCLTHAQVDAIRHKFNALNPYRTVDDLLKFEHGDIPDLRCWAISAKRYALFRWRPGHRLEVVKASESGLGAIIGRTSKETTTRLARRVWLAILVKELKGVNASQRRRAKTITDFSVPLRRKFPISQPSILQRLKTYNERRSYEQQVKPGGFVQTVTPALVTGSGDVLPIAPFEQDLGKSKRLVWIDFKRPTEALHLDWSAGGYADMVPVMRMDEYIEQYGNHAETKAADANGYPADRKTTGVLRRLTLRSIRLSRIGKEIDRLEQDEASSLEGRKTIEFEPPRGDVKADIAYLATFPQESTAHDIGISERRWRDIAKGIAKPRRATAERIALLAAQYRLSSNELAT